MSAAHHARHVRPRPGRPPAVRGARRGDDLGAQVHLPVVARRARHAGRDWTTTDACGRRRRRPRWRASAVTVLDIYGSLFFAAAPKIRESLPSVGDAHCPVVVLRLRGRGTLHSATIAVLREYAAECAARGGRLYLAGVGREMEDQLRRTGVLGMLGPDAVVAATDELYGACATAQQRGRVVACRARRRTGPGPPGGLRRRHSAVVGRAGDPRRVSRRRGKPALRVLAAPVVEGRDRELARRPRRLPAALALLVGRPDLHLRVRPRVPAELHPLREPGPPRAGRARCVSHESNLLSGGAGADPARSSGPAAAAAVRRLS